MWSMAGYCLRWAGSNCMCGVWHWSFIIALLPAYFTARAVKSDAAVVLKAVFGGAPERCPRGMMIRKCHNTVRKYFGGVSAEIRQLGVIISDFQALRCIGHRGGHTIVRSLHSIGVRSRFHRTQITFNDAITMINTQALQSRSLACATRSNVAHCEQSIRGAPCMAFQPAVGRWKMRHSVQNARRRGTVVSNAQGSPTPQQVSSPKRKLLYLVTSWNIVLRSH